MKKIIKVKKYVNNANVSRFRAWIQFFSFLLFIYGGYFLIHVGQNLPTFACPYNSGSPGTCYLIALQHSMHTTWDQLFSWRGFGVLTGFLSFLLFFVIFNKAWCGFFCPLGTLQDWITKLRKLTFTRFTRYDQMSFKRLKKIKYVFLAIIILIPLGISNSFFGLPKFSHDLGAPFCQVCPARTILPLFTGDTSQIFIDFTNTTTIIMSSLGILFMALFFVGSFFKKRFFCFFCPMSALQHLFSRMGILRLTKDGTQCTRCGNCYRVCDVGIIEIAEDIESKFIVKEDCMMCFKCVEACPEEGALDVKVLKWSIFSSTQEGFFKRYGQGDEFDEQGKIDFTTLKDKADE